jgi:hypothetical protein
MLTAEKIRPQWIKACLLCDGWRCIDDMPGMNSVLLEKADRRIIVPTIYTDDYKQVVLRLSERIGKINGVSSTDILAHWQYTDVLSQVLPYYDTAVVTLGGTLEIGFGRILLNPASYNQTAVREQEEQWLIESVLDTLSDVQSKDEFRPLPLRLQYVIAMVMFAMNWSEFDVSELRRGIITADINPTNLMCFLISDSILACDLWSNLRVLTCFITLDLDVYDALSVCRGHAKMKQAEGIS